jgi:hypothetical protein
MATKPHQIRISISKPCLKEQKNRTRTILSLIRIYSLINPLSLKGWKILVQIISINFSPSNPSKEFTSFQVQTKTTQKAKPNKTHMITTHI